VIRQARIPAAKMLVTKIPAARTLAKKASSEWKF
jgi:hypothetical protein